MKARLFAVWDSKVEEYLPLFQEATPASAERAFREAVNSSDHHFGKYPEDFTLFQIGTLDTKKGLVEQDKFSICNGIEVKHGTDQGERQEPSLTQIQ